MVATSAPASRIANATARPRPLLAPLTNATLPSSENGLAAIFADQKNAMVLISMLSRIGASGGVVGSSNALWPMKRARPSVSES